MTDPKPHSGAPIRVLLADDHPIVRAGIREVLKGLPGVEVVAEASDGREAIALVKSASPHVVLLDISMPNLNGLEAAERIVKAFPKVRVVILSRHENEEYYWRALRMGASGYLLKKAVVAELRSAVQRVAAGEIYLSREIADRLHRAQVIRHPFVFKRYATLAQFDRQIRAGEYDFVAGESYRRILERLRQGKGEFLAELRPAQVFFMNFTGIDFDNDPVAGEKLDAFIRWVQKVLQRYDAYMFQMVIGDKGNYLYGAFGAPIAHEDDAIRAVSAALELSTPPDELSYIQQVKIGISARSELPSASSV